MAIHLWGLAMKQLLSALLLVLWATGALAQTPQNFTPMAGFTGGARVSTILSAVSNNSTLIKAGPATLYAFTWVQTTTTLMDIRYYDTATAPTCSSATGMKINLPAQSNAVSAGATITPGGPVGVAFANGIGVCITGANANNDNANATTGLNLVTTFN